MYKRLAMARVVFFEILSYTVIQEMLKGEELWHITFQMSAWLAVLASTSAR